MQVQTRPYTLISGRYTQALAENIAKELKVNLADIITDDFANGEVYCRVNESLRGDHVFVIQSHCGDVNSSIMEQLILIDAIANKKSVSALFKGSNQF